MPVDELGNITVVTHIDSNWLPFVHAQQLDRFNRSSEWRLALAFTWAVIETLDFHAPALGCE
jgi:hypothetical protein